MLLLECLNDDAHLENAIHYPYSSYLYISAFFKSCHKVLVFYRQTTSWKSNSVQNIYSPVINCSAASDETFLLFVFMYSCKTTQTQQVSCATVCVCLCGNIDVCVLLSQANCAGISSSL